MKNTILFSLATMLFLACQKVDCDLACHEIELGGTVTLGVNESVKVKGKNFKITFLEISEESRCPINASCIWGGHALAQFLIEKGNNSKNDSLSTIERPNMGLSSTHEVFNKTIKLIEVSPYPDYVNLIDPKDYKVTIKVE